MSDDNIKKIEFALEQLTEKGRNLLDYAKNHPEVFVISGVAIAGGVAIITIPLALGFWPAGVVAGTAAAAWQASLGSVAAGSLFAMLQSLTMSGTLLAVGGCAIFGGSLALIAESGVMNRLTQMAKDTDWNDVSGDKIDWLRGNEWAEQVGNQLINVGKEIGEKAGEAAEKTQKSCESFGKDMETVGREIGEGASKIGEDIGRGLENIGK